MKQEEIIRMAKSRIEGATEDLKKFAGEVLENPAYALRWASAAFGHAGKKAAWTYILDAAEGGVTLEDLVDELSNIVIKGAKRVPASSNPCANLLEQEETAAYADALEYFSRVRKIRRAEQGDTNA